jgi:hypothetical protein
MRHSLRFQFGIRTLLIAMLLVGIALCIGVRLQKSREDRLWLVLDEAKQRRNEAIKTWRTTYDQIAAGNLGLQDEAVARERYFAYRAQVETAVREISAYYGGTEKALHQAVHRRNAERSPSEPIVRLLD